jgi:Fe-S oxidoreductase
MKLCKCCGEKEAFKYSPYSTGEFCSRECARCFSTKEKRKEINAKVSETLKGSGNEDVVKVCPTCNNQFTMIYKHRYKGFCSRKCANADTCVRKLISTEVKLVKTGVKAPMTLAEINTKKESARKKRRENFDIGFGE